MHFYTNPPEDNVLSLNNDLKMRTNEEWSELARYYAKTNAILIPRALYKGTKIGQEKEITIVDDWMVNKDTLLLFNVWGTQATDTVDALIGNWIGHTDSKIVDLKEYFSDDDYTIYNILHWDPNTFSWNIQAEKLSNIDLAFSDRGFDTSKNHAAFLDVPFGHVVSKIHREAIDDLNENLFRYYATPACTLGEIGRDFCNKHGPGLARMFI